MTTARVISSLVALTVAITAHLPSVANADPAPQGPGGPMSPTQDFRNIAGTFLGREGDERVQGISIMPGSGNILVCGETSSVFETLLPSSPWVPTSPFPMTFDKTYNGGTFDAYIAILSPDLTQLLNWTYLGGSSQDRAYYAIADSFENVYVTGITTSEGLGCGGTFPVTPGYCYGTSGAGFGDFDVFVAKFTPDLVTLTRSLIIAGMEGENPRGSLTISESHNAVYISGRAGSGFPVGVGPGLLTQAPLVPHQLNYGGAEDSFLVKFDLALDPKWATYYGGPGKDNANANVRISLGSVFIAGCTGSATGIIPTGFVPYQAGPPGGPPGTWGATDGFVARFNDLTGVLEAATYLGGESTDWVGFNDDMELDPLGNIVVQGITRSNCFPMVNWIFPNHSKCSTGCGCTLQPDIEASDDVFVATLLPSLGPGSLVFSTYFGGGKREEPAGLAIDQSGHIYMTGETLSANIPITSNAYDSTFTTVVNDNMAYLVELDPVAHTLVYSTYLGGNVDCGSNSIDGSRGRSLVYDETSGNVILCGQTTQCDFPVRPTAVFPSYWPSDREGWVGIHWTH